MKRLIGRLTLGISLVGIAAGAGGVLLNPATGISGEERDEMTEDRVCVEGCNPDTEFCCDEKEPE